MVYRSYHSRSRCKCTYFSFVKMNRRIQHRVIASLSRNRWRRRWPRGIGGIGKSGIMSLPTNLLCLGGRGGFLGLGLGGAGRVGGGRWAPIRKPSSYSRTYSIRASLLETCLYERSERKKGRGHDGYEGARWEVLRGNSTPNQGRPTRAWALHSLAKFTPFYPQGVDSYFMSISRTIQGPIY